MQRATTPEALSTATGEGIATLLGAAAATRHEVPAGLLEALPARLRMMEPPPTPAEIARMAWCLAVLGAEPPGGFFDLLASLMLRWHSDFPDVPLPAAAIAEMGWAFAVANVHRSDLMAMLMAQTVVVAPAFTCVDICNLVSAIAKFRSDTGPVMLLLAQRLLAPAVLPTMQVPQAVGILWAYASLAIAPPDLLSVLSGYLCAPAVLPRLSRAQILTLLWCCGQLHLTASPLATLLTRRLADIGDPPQ